MPITAASLSRTIYNVGAPQVIQKVAATRNEHYMYDTNAARIDDHWTADPQNPNLENFQGTPNAAGAMIYLPYDDDHITSVRLPNPPPAGVDRFMTANMSGCRFFVDTIAGSADLMVYHANTHQHGAPPHNTPVNFQSPAALGLLTAMHANAQADYAILPAPNNLTLHNVAELRKGTYYAAGARDEQRKANQGRNLVLPGGQVATPEFVGGCTVCGFYQGNSWHFYYQTWGDVDYDRPGGAKNVAKDLVTFHWKSVHKLGTQGTTHRASYTKMTVVDHGLIY